MAEPRASREGYRTRSSENRTPSRRPRRRRRRYSYRLYVMIGVLILLLLLLVFLLSKLFGGGGDKKAAETTMAPESAIETTAAETTAAAIPAPTAAPAAANEWYLILVNKDNPVPEDYQVELTSLRNDQSVDSRIYPDLQAMFDEMRAQGLSPMITSSYRSAEDQQKIMDNKIAEYKEQGYTDEDARELAEEWVAKPGTSEHQLGISIDISSTDSEDSDMKVNVWNWLIDNSYKYGFIQRYPEDKTEITGIINEPWHYRYVGKEAAKEIFDQNITLEEYLGAY